jgi:hypothetical protein
LQVRRWKIDRYPDPTPIAFFYACVLLKGANNMSNVNIAALPADHYAAPAELHLMGDRREQAAEYLGVACLPQVGYLEPCYTEPTHLTKATDPAAEKAAQLSEYVAKVGEKPLAEVISTANEVVGTPDIIIKARPEHLHAAVVAQVESTRAARNAAYQARLAAQQQQHAAVAQS